MAYIKDYTHNKDEEKKEHSPDTKERIEKNVISSGKSVVIAQTLTMEGIALTLGIPLMVIGILTLIVGLVKEDSLDLLLTGLLMLAVSAICILAIKRIEYDKQQKRIRIYREYFIFRLGEWDSLEKYTSIKISFLHTIQASRAINGMSTQWGNTTSKYFNVYLSSEGKARLPLFGFTEKEEARNFQKKMSEVLGMTAYPEIIRVVNKVYELA